MDRGVIASFIILFIILGSCLLIGCSKKEGQELKADDLIAGPDDSGEDSPDALAEEPAEEGPAVILSTAKEGFTSAEASVKKNIPDAVFVGAKADMDTQGRSEAWTYSFDSIKNSKGYELTGGIMREKKFSFQPELKEWVDSSSAAKLCGAGDATLEAGKWVVASEKGVCQLDAATGEKDEI